MTATKPREFWLYEDPEAFTPEDCYFGGAHTKKFTDDCIHVVEASALVAKDEELRIAYAMFDSIKEDSDKLRELLSKYGDHKNDCSVLNGGWLCECGYKAAKEALSGGEV